MYNPPPGPYGQGYPPGPGPAQFPGPMPGPAPGAAPPGDAGGKVALPAMLMLILSGIAILFNLFGIAMNLLGAGLGAASGGDEGMHALFSGTAGLISGFISLLFNGFVIFGALKMKQLQSHTLATVAAVLFSLPCSICCLLNTPIGIWALVTLMDAKVKASFTS